MIGPRTYRAALEEESGLAMVSILGITSVLTLVSVIAISIVLNAQTFSRNHQDWNAALAAAEAGVDDYLARLNRDRGYFLTAAGDLDGDGNNRNPALDRWAQLPDSDAFYHYSVDIDEVERTGALTLTSIGRVGDETRTVQVRIRPEGFFDFIYLTDVEVVDPVITGLSNPDEACGHPYGERAAGCQNLRFVTGDILDGPVHSNDAIQMEGNPVFEGPTTTHYNPMDGGFIRFLGRAADPVFARAGDPAWDIRRGFPPTNETIITDAENFGCIYYGPTYIHITGDTMTVKSPLSTSPPAGRPPTRPECAGPGPSGGPVSALTGYVSGITVPPVIYVGEASACSGGFSQDNHPLQLSRNEETRSGLRYNCTDGDVFVWGELDGQLTINASKNINIIWDLIYQDGNWTEGTNMLGLVADQFVQVRQPRAAGADAVVRGQPPFPNSATPPNDRGNFFSDPEIHAAILSLTRSFRVQNHDAITPLGDLIVRGSIAQRYRGPVGTGTTTSISTGFLKDYRYDERLRFISPPFFIDPVRAQYRVTSWAEVRADIGFPGDSLPDFPNP